MDDLASLDATACAALVRTGQVSPRQLVDAAIDRIDRHDGELGAVIVRRFDQARREADGDLPDGPFRGVPILIKDICAQVEGLPYAAGVRPLRQLGLRAAHDSYLVARLRQAGFIILGKTNTSELGILPAAEPPAFPPSRNPYDLTRTTGGSSGGAGAAVAAGLVPIGHGNDGGGSIRIPAACCGLFGLKPSRARVSLGPDLGDVNGGLVAEHVLTRSVRDSAAVLDVLAGPMPGDPYAAPPPRRPFAAEVGAPPGRLRIGFATRHLDTEAGVRPAHPTCVGAVEATARRLAALGHDVCPFEITALHDPEWTPRFLTLWAVGVAQELAEIEAVLGRTLVDADVEPLTAVLGALGRGVPAPVYAAAWRWIHRASRVIAASWDEIDLWLCPTVTTPPPRLGTFSSRADDPLPAIFAAGEFAPFTAPFNATGQPAASVPVGHDGDGLPLAVQLVGGYGREDLLLQVASQLEADQPFVHRATRR
ncbi:MAG: amidase [Kofleriaceae bacterium]|nr:amidase [Kofleriaceae bacterium]